MSNLATTARGLLGTEAGRWAADFRKRWRAQDDTEELYLRRVSEQAAHQILDDAGVPHGELSLNGRIASACRIRYASNTAAVETDREASDVEEAPVSSAARAALRTVPAAPWPVATSGLSLDVGPVRVRFDGGSQELRRALARWISMSRTWVEGLTGPR